MTEPEMLDSPPEFSLVCASMPKDIAANGYRSNVG